MLSCKTHINHSHGTLPLSFLLTFLHLCEWRTYTMSQKACHFKSYTWLWQTLPNFYRQDAAKRQTAGIKFIHRPKIRFSPRRGNSLHRFKSNLAGPTGTWVRLTVQNFASIAKGGWECGPKNFHFLVKRVLDRFRKFLRAFIRLTIIH